MKVGIYAIIGILSTIPFSIVVPMILFHYFPAMSPKIGVLIMGAFWTVSFICLLLIDKEATKKV